ncbi:uncharacterized protein LOC101851613 [Aplysia californica]|uniref:Uncharacterized protein LOC101851613 n=1 Tax=Aplysia californica TaxID=6500 RepID=A0ABM1ABJ5_APLCA|nr:uncharacterized protein LOC101851613 [Aplysia californica]
MEGSPTIESGGNKYSPNEESQAQSQKGRRTSCIVIAAVVIGCLLVVALVLGVYFGLKGSDESSQPESQVRGHQNGTRWNDLSVTWGPIPSDPKYFAQMPRTVQNALSLGFKKISDCDLTVPWRGQRFVKDNDYAVVLLYDVNGYIAGIQTSIPNNGSSGYPSASVQPPFVTDGDRYTISAYFVNPSIICTKGRTKEEFSSQGTGSNLYLQRTEDPEASTLIPRQETGIAATKWTEGQCFASMGRHYWYDVRRDMSCDSLFPVFLLYNWGRLTAFGWAMVTDLSSLRYEHPSAAVLQAFIKEPPTCLFQMKAISTMHIYLIDDAHLSPC